MARLSPLLVAIVIALAIAGCLIGNGYQVYLIAMVCLTAIIGVGLNVLLGLTGQVSLGHVGFFAIGALAWLLVFAGSQFAFIALGWIPMRQWLSFRRPDMAPPASPPPPDNGTLPPRLPLPRTAISTSS